MVHECQYIYESGRKCRRIPKRGESLCPGHRPDRKRSVHDDPDFRRQIAAFIDQLRSADTLSLLCCLQDAMRTIQPTIERKSSRATYVPFARAAVVVAIAIERLSATPAPSQSCTTRALCRQIDAHRASGRAAPSISEQNGSALRIEK